MKVVRNTVLGLWTIALCVSASIDAAETRLPERKRTSDSDEEQARFRKFEETLSGVKLVGRFTVLGRDERPPAKEEYTIHRVEKMPRGDYWMFHTRLQYGKIDVNLPLPLEVKWADDTPIISLTNLAIPLLGTFSSRVVIYNGKYAGTWTHGKATGHLFGVIEPLPADESPAANETSREP